jgi:hypothetical protein
VELENPNVGWQDAVSAVETGKFADLVAGAGHLYVLFVKVGTARSTVTAFLLPGT